MQNTNETIAVGNLPKTGTDGLRQRAIAFLQDGVRSFTHDASLAEIMFLAEELHAREAAYQKEAKDHDRCLIADIIHEHLNEGFKLESRATGT